MRRVVQMFRETRNSVVNSSMVGKIEKSKAVFTYMAIMSMRKDRVRLQPMSVSTSQVGKGMIIRVITQISRKIMLMSLCRVMNPTAVLARPSACWSTA